MRIRKPVLRGGDSQTRVTETPCLSAGFETRKNEELKICGKRNIWGRSQESSGSKR